MARNKLPASLQKGHTWSKEQLEQMDRLEQDMRGKDDVIEEVPEYLDDIAKIYYQFLVDNLRESKVPLSNLDKPTIEMVADALSKIYQCQLAIKEQGLVIKKYDKNGNENLAPNPHIKILHDYQNKYNQMASTLGLTPSSRSSLASMQIENKQEQEDPVLQILQGIYIRPLLHHVLCIPLQLSYIRIQRIQHLLFLVLIQIN